MNSRKIGKIVSIRNNNIIGEIYPNIRNYINTLDETLFVGEIGSYVSIYNFDKIIIAEIVAIDATTDINEKNYNKPQETKKVILNLVGELQEKENSNKNNDNKDYSFTFGVSRMPLIFSDIYITSKDEIDGIFNITNENEYLELGTSIINDNYEIKADINNLFGSHFAVLGNTGAGKSNTIASIIQKIFNTKNNADNTNNATFIFIDSNGEYADAWSELSNNNVKVIQYKVPDDLVNNKSNPDEDKYEDEKDANSSTTKQENSINSNSQNSSENMNKMSDAKTVLPAFEDSPYFDSVEIAAADLGSGKITYSVKVKDGLFYKALSSAAENEIADDFALMSYVKELSAAKKHYDKIKDALNCAVENGYGVVAPSIDEMKLEEPEIVRQGSRYGVKLKASAPSLHIMSVEVSAEVSPIMGTEQQNEETVRKMLDGFEGNPLGIWNTNMFGKSMEELVNESINDKLNNMPPEARKKMRKTLSRIINEGKGGVICILL